MTISAQTQTQLIPPRRSLASCVRAFVVRSTLNAELSENQRVNHFPAGPVCAISWHIAGQSVVIERGQAMAAEMMPRVAISGPPPVPFVTRNQGPVHLFMMMCTPDVMHALTGLDMTEFVGRFLPLTPILGADWQAMSKAVLEASTDQERLDVVQDFLEPKWVGARLEKPSLARRLSDWAEDLAVRAAGTAAGAGTSLRQMERRVKMWTGMPLRNLRSLTKGEEILLHARYLDENSVLAPISVVERAGLSDQSHLGRVTLRLSGLTPQKLWEAIHAEESFWLYRVWK